MLTFDQKLDSGEEGLGTRLVKPTANETEPCSQAPPLPALPGPSHIFCSTTVWEDLGTRLNHSWMKATRPSLSILHSVKSSKLDSNESLWTRLVLNLTPFDLWPPPVCGHLPLQWWNGEYLPLQLHRGHKEEHVYSLHLRGKWEPCHVWVCRLWQLVWVALWRIRYHVFQLLPHLAWPRCV